MNPRRGLCYAVSVALLLAFISGCGSGSGNAGGGTQPTPSFTLSLSPVTLTQGGAVQTAQVTLTPANGFSGSVSVTVSGLASSISVSPSSLVVSPGTPGTFTFSAAADAPTGQVSGTLQGLSLQGVSTTASAPFSVTVRAAPAVPFPFVSVGGYLIHGFYDASRQLLFAANPELNELDVIAQSNLSIKARIPLPAAWGVDQMADGNTLVVGTDAQVIYTVNEDTHAVTRYPVPNLGVSYYTLFYPNPIAMANGKVILIGQQQGIESDNELDGGQFLIEWDSTSNTFSQLTTPTGDSIGADSLARSADHKWAVFGSDPLYLYNSASGSLTSVPAATVNPPINEFGISAYAVNANGSKIAFVSAHQVTFTDGSFNVLGSVPIPGAFQSGGSVEFSHDGSRLFLYYGAVTAYANGGQTGLIGVEAIDANGLTNLGYYSAAAAYQGSDLSFLDVDTNGRLYFGADSGLRYTDTTAAPVPVAATSFLPGPICPSPTPVYFPLNTASQVSLEALESVASGTSIYLGGYPATVPSSGPEYNVDIPASSVPGPVGEECIDPSGYTTALPDAISYGVQVTASSANLLPATGTPTIDLFGYGILDSTLNSHPVVTVGGSTAQVIGSNSNTSLGSLQLAGVTVPQGTPGAQASISVSNANGSGSLANAVAYLPATTIVPATGLLGLQYDTHRNLLYALKAGEVDVLDPTTLTWKTPLLTNRAFSLNFADMALSPDGTKMVITTTSQNVVVLDPDNPASTSVTSCVLPPTSQINSISITQSNVAVLTGPCSLALDLSTMNVTHGGFGLGFFRASADGSHIYGAQLNNSSGTVTSVDVSSLAAQSETFGYEYWTDVAVSPDGSHFAVIDAPTGADGDIIAFFDSALHYSYTNDYPVLSPPTGTGALGALYGPQGEVLAVPLGDSVEFWDAAKGTLRARLMTPEPLNVLVYPETSAAGQIAFDSTGQYLYAVSASGLTAFKLPTPVDQLASAQWPSAVSQASIQPTAYGTPAARMAAMRSLAGK